MLQLVERIATPTPRLIGVDPTGELAGTPAVLMTELPGRPEWTAGQRWMRQLVEILVDVHDIDAGQASMVRPLSVSAQESYALPKWVTKPAAWERAIEVFHGPVLDEDRTFIHRDFYAGNVLWHRRTVSALVDWEAASVGPRSMDVAHCRINQLYEGLDTAEVFTREWEQHTGRTFNRWADIATIIGLLDAERRTLQPRAGGSTSRRCCSVPSTRSTARRPAHRTRAATAPDPGNRRSAPIRCCRSSVDG